MDKQYNQNTITCAYQRLIKRHTLTLAGSALRVVEKIKSYPLSPCDLPADLWHKNYSEDDPPALMETDSMGSVRLPPLRKNNRHVIDLNLNQQGVLQIARPGMNDNMPSIPSFANQTMNSDMVGNFMQAFMMRMQQQQQQMQMFMNQVHQLVQGASPGTPLANTPGLSRRRSAPAFPALPSSSQSSQKSDSPLAIQGDSFDSTTDDNFGHPDERDADEGADAAADIPEPNHQWACMII